MSDQPPPPGGQPPPPPWPQGGGTPPPPPPGGFQQYGYGYGAGATASYASFGMRLLALILDDLIIGVPLGIIGAAVGGGAGWQLIELIIGVAYFASLEGGATGQTVGKRICGVRVVDAETGQPGVGIGRAIGRYFGRILSGLVLLLGFLWMLWDPKKQTWHDKLARTIVVKA